jgi:hypothetical protein
VDAGGAAPAGDRVPGVLVQHSPGLPGPVVRGLARGQRRRLEEFCQLLAGTEHAAGARLRALAVELARLGDLEVAAVAYEDESLELEKTAQMIAAVTASCVAAR